jgi:hypothetical protein
MFTRKVVAALAAIGFLAAAGGVPVAHADDLSCQVNDLPMGATRYICDEPLRPDGSWLRHRKFTHDAHYAPEWFNCYGGQFYRTCDRTGGGYYPYSEGREEVYVVTPQTILFGEPGHQDMTGQPFDN